MEFISSEFGASIKANPLDSWVSGLRMTFTASETKPSAASHDLISSAVTQTGRFPKNTVKLIYSIVLTPWGLFRDRVGGAAHESISILTHDFRREKTVDSL